MPLIRFAGVPSRDGHFRSAAGLVLRSRRTGVGNRNLRCAKDLDRSSGTFHSAQNYQVIGVLSFLFVFKFLRPVDKISVLLCPFFVALLRLSRNYIGNGMANSLFQAEIDFLV